MSDIDPGLDALRLGDDPPAREGLPPRYRMRADAHYVEQLDSSLLNSPIRFLEVHGLDAPRQDDDEGPSPAFVESIRRHGVLQPLLVRSRGGRHLVIAGRKRLAAAAAAGLSRVPCLIERADDEQASMLAAATNTPSVDTPVARVPQMPAPPTTDLTFAAFADCLTAVASSANLLSPGSTLTQTVAVDLVRAEAARALQLLLAARVLRGDVSVARREVAARTVVERAVDQTAAERRLRGLTVDAPSRKVSETVSGDEDLLAASFSALIRRAGRAVRNGARESHLAAGQLACGWDRGVVSRARRCGAAALLAVEAGGDRMAGHVDDRQQRLECRARSAARGSPYRRTARRSPDARLLGRPDHLVGRASWRSLVNSQPPTANAQRLTTTNSESRVC